MANDAGERVTTRDGRWLHLERSGEGGPTVVFEAGMGSSRNAWGAVAPAVADHTSVAVYDRAGLGRSPADPRPRTLDRLVEDHLDVLDHLGPGPFVLVSHSWGGPIVRVVASQVPERVAGLVLVDQTDEGCDLFFSKANERISRWSEKLMPVMARLGLVKVGVKALAKQLPEPARTHMVAEDGTAAAIRTHNSEMHGSITDLQRLRDVPPVLPDIPVSIISGLKNGRGERNRRPELIVAHKARAAALPQGRHVGAPASSHYVPFTEPRIVVDEVLRIVDQVRGA